VLCTEGSATLRTGQAQSGPSPSGSAQGDSAQNGLRQGEPGCTIELGRGGSCFIAAADGPVRATGRARLFLASPGEL
jgi:hypothetical protein